MDYIDRNSWLTSTLELTDLRPLERALWGVVGLALLGDVLTTLLGLHLGFSESNPIARGAIDSWGLLGMLALKAGAIGVALAGRRLLPVSSRPIVPAALAIPWLAATGINLFVISTAL